jgi:hypothetical protein
MPLSLIALVDEVQAHLQRGDLVDLGEVDLGPAGVWPHAADLAMIVLAEVAHYLERGRLFGELIAAGYLVVLEAQLHSIEQAIAKKLASE